MGTSPILTVELPEELKEGYDISVVFVSETDLAVCLHLPETAQLPPPKTVEFLLNGEKTTMHLKHANLIAEECMTVGYKGKRTNAIQVI